MSTQVKPTRTQIADLPEISVELSPEEMQGVFGGAAALAHSTIGTTVMAAHGTNLRTNTNCNGCHDYDSEWDYSTY